MGPVELAGVDRKSFCIWILVFDTDRLLDVQRIGVVRVHVVPKALSMHVANEVEGYDVFSPGPLFPPTSWRVVVTGEERRPFADEERIIGVPGPGDLPTEDLVLPTIANLCPCVVSVKWLVGVCSLGPVRSALPLCLNGGIRFARYQL